MQFSIVIPTYNNLEELKGCLASIGGLQGASFHVVVGVDGSTDGTWEWLEGTSFPFDCIFVRHADGKNHGRSATRNLALKHLKGRFTLFLDSDMQVAADLLQEHGKLVEGGNAVSIGAVRYQNPKDNIWVRYTSERGVAKFPHQAEVPFHYFITPNSVVPTSYLLELEGFDPKISRYGGEDMELGYRIFRKYGPRFWYNQSAYVQTVQPKTLHQALPQLREYGATGLRYITAKWPELSNIYWVSKCHSKRWKDRLFEMLTWSPFRVLAKGLVPVMPYAIQRHLISYLVVANIHSGYRTGKA